MKHLLTYILFIGCFLVSTIGFTQCPTLNIINKNDVSCFGGFDGSATVQITPDPSPMVPPCGSYTIAWSNGSNNATISGLSSGIYSVEVTNNCTGCISFAIAIIDEPYELTSSISKTDAKCRNQASGFVDLEVTGGTPNYSYSWNNSATTQDLFNVTAGGYNVTVTDNNGCTTTNNIIVNHPASNISSSTITKDASCNLGNDGEVDLTVFGGTAPYTYSWNGGLFLSQDITGLLQGPYNVTITDANGCTKTDNATVNEPTAITSNIAPSDVLCNGTSTGMADLTVFGGTPPYNYSWRSSNFTLGSTEDLSNVLADKYYVTITDDNGCIKEDSTVINQPDILRANEALTAVSCNGFSDGRINLTTIGGNIPYTYAWSDGNGPLPNTTEDLINIPAQTYTLALTDNNGCQFDTSYIITEPPTPITVTHTKVDIDCYANNTGSIDISVTGGTFPYAYSWSHGPTTQDVSDLFFGNYTLTVTDANGCVEIVNIFIDQPANPLQVVPSIIPASCYDTLDGDITLTVTGGTTPYSYNWINSSVTLSATSKDLIDFGADQYAVTITDSNNCLLVDTFDLPQPSQLVLSLTKVDVLCFGDATGSIDLEVQGGTMAYNYNWSNSQITQDINSLTDGVYTINLEDNNGCKISDSIEITQPIAPLSSSYNQTDVTCHGGNDGSIIYTVAGGTPVFNYNWSNGSFQKDIFNISAGEYTIRTTDNNGCILDDTINIIQPDFVTITANVTPVRCKGEGSGAIDVSVTGGTPSYSYFWTNSDFVLSAFTQDLTDLQPDTYTVTVTDTNGCKGTVSYLVVEPDELLLNPIKKDVTCKDYNDGEVRLNTTGGNPGYTYSWSNSGTTNVVSNLSPGVYTVTANDTKGCLKQESFTIIEPDEIRIVSDVTPVSCKDQKDGIIVANPEGGNGAYQYLWSTGSTINTIDQLGGGLYQITVTDILGCTGDTVVEMTINPQACLDLPNTFTPNGDGINDTWVIDNLFLYDDAQLNIFNEWGTLVFQGGPESEWDGKANGNDLPNGTYYYVLKVLAGEETYAGGITIIK